MLTPTWAYRNFLHDCLHGVRRRERLGLKPPGMMEDGEPNERAFEAWLRDAAIIKAPEPCAAPPPPAKPARPVRLWALPCSSPGLTTGHWVFSPGPVPQETSWTAALPSAQHG